MDSSIPVVFKWWLTNHKGFPMHLQGGTYNVQFFSYPESEKIFVNKMQVKMYNTIKKYNMYI